MIRPFLSSLILILAACETPGGASSVGPNPSDWEGQGILVRVGDELHLFEDPMAVGKYPDQCTTLAAKSKEDLARFTKLVRKPVKVSGRAIPWPEATVSLKIQGSTIRNMCNSSDVIVAQRIVAM